MSQVIAILATLDTKAQEAEYLRERIEAQGSRATVIDLGVIGTPGTTANVTREEIARAGGTPLEELLRDPRRDRATPVMVAGATKVLSERVARGETHAVLGLGGTQGTASCTEIMRALPYGFPKVMVSTVASGDTSPYVDIKDVTMMFSVSDLVGLNPLTRKILANAAGAACGMAGVEVTLDRTPGDKPVIGMTNLGVLTEGTQRALQRFEAAGYEVIVFHAVGSGGRAMEQMMKEGLVGAVFDYALGEIADDLHHALRAGGPERLTVAGELGLPQVICPGGAEHLGLIVDPPNHVPDPWKDHAYVFHSPIVFVPRLGAEEMVEVAREIGRRLAGTRENACMMLPRRGTSRYAVEGAELHDPTSDAAFFAALREHLPDTIEIIEHDTHAEDEEFVGEAVDRLIRMIETR